MHVVVYLPLLASAALGASGPYLSRRMPPATAVRLLAVGAFVVALATGFTLSVVAFLLLARLPWLARVGHWSAAALQAADPLPALVGPALGIGVVVLAGMAVRGAVQGGRDLWAAQAACRHLRGDAAGLVVVDDARAEAFAVPGITGRVVVSTAMLRALPAPERRVLLAHEASHLRHRHYLYVLAVELAAAANPLLRPLASAIRAGVERWADEDAAALVGDRRVAARALARAGLARAAHRVTPQPPGPLDGLAAVALGVAGSPIITRVQALLAPPPGRRRLLALAVASIVVCAVMASLEVRHDTETAFEHAQTDYHATR